MRKLGILIALIAAATLGTAHPASAQDPPQKLICDPFGEAAGLFVQDTISGQHGEPFTSTFTGAEQSCLQSGEAGIMVSPLLCGVAKGLDAQPGGGAGSSTVGAANDGIAADGRAPAPLKFTKCAPDKKKEDGGTTPPGGGGGGTAGGGGAGAQVQAASATADGGLPRTGGELFAGAGFALMSLGALVRRFLP